MANHPSARQRHELVHVWIERVDVNDALLVNGVATFRWKAIVTVGLLTIVQGRERFSTLTDDVGRWRRWTDKHLLMQVDRFGSFPTRSWCRCWRWIVAGRLYNGI